MIDNTALALQHNVLDTLVEAVDQHRIDANQLLDQTTRGQKGQFMTPASVTRILAGMFRNLDGEIRILDAGAGVGSTTCPSAFTGPCAPAEAAGFCSTGNAVAVIVQGTGDGAIVDVDGFGFEFAVFMPDLLDVADTGLLKRFSNAESPVIVKPEFQPTFEDQSSDRDFSAKNVGKAVGNVVQGVKNTANAISGAYDSAKTAVSDFEKGYDSSTKPTSAAKPTKQVQETSEIGRAHV